MAHIVFLPDNVSLEEHHTHLFLFNASVFGVKVPLWNFTFFYHNSLGYHHHVKLLKADLKQSGTEVKLCLGLSQSHLSQSRFSFSLFQCMPRLTYRSSALKSCSPRLNLSDKAIQYSNSHYDDLSSMCSPLRDIFILKYIACRAQWLTQRDEFTDTMTSNFESDSARGPSDFSFLVIYQQKQNKKPSSSSRFSSCFHLSPTSK